VDPVPNVPKIKLPFTSGVVEVDPVVEVEVEVGVEVEVEVEVEVLAGARNTYAPATTIRIKTTPRTT
jgi:hypothetical protein